MEFRANFWYLITEKTNEAESLGTVMRQSEHTPVHLARALQLLEHFVRTAGLQAGDLPRQHGAREAHLRHGVHVPDRGSEGDEICVAAMAANWTSRLFFRSG